MATWKALVIAIPLALIALAAGMPRDMMLLGGF